MRQKQMIIHKIFDLIKLELFKSKWRHKNGHNNTYARSIFPFEIVNVGFYSYGPLNVEYYGAINEKLVIGSFVSVARDVKFVLGGNHHYDILTTFPLRTHLMNFEIKEAVTKGPIIIKDDVWIGCNSIILSGVEIGQGAVVAAGSVITKNIPPYAMVGGNPAKIIKFRFEQEIIDKLLSLDLSHVDRSIIMRNIDIFYKKLDLDTLGKIEKLLKTN